MQCILRLSTADLFRHSFVLYTCSQLRIFTFLLLLHALQQMSGKLIFLHKKTTGQRELIRSRALVTVCLSWITQQWSPVTFQFSLTGAQRYLNKTLWKKVIVSNQYVMCYMYWVLLKLLYGCGQVSVMIYYNYKSVHQVIMLASVLWMWMNGTQCLKSLNCIGNNHSLSQWCHHYQQMIVRAVVMLYCIQLHICIRSLIISISVRVWSVDFFPAPTFFIRYFFSWLTGVFGVCVSKKKKEKKEKRI